MKTTESDQISQPSAVPLRGAGLALRLTAIAGALVVSAGLFLYAGGWFTPEELTPAAIIDTFEYVNGVHPGFRRAGTRALRGRKSPSAQPRTRRPVLWLVLAPHPMDLARVQRQLAEHRAMDHPVVAGGVVGGHTSFVAPEQMDRVPIHAEVKPRGDQAIHVGGSIAAGQGHRELTVGTNRLTRNVYDFFRGAHEQSGAVVQDNDLRLSHNT